MRRRKLYNAFDLMVTALFFLIIMPLLFLSLLFTAPAFRTLHLMNRCRRYLSATFGGGK